MDNKNDTDAASSNHVYVITKEDKWSPAILISTDAETATVQLKNCKTSVTVSLKDYNNQVLPLQNVDADGKLIVVDDMVDLPYLHEAAIMDNLKARHQISLPYTKTAEITMCVNPYEWLHHLYTTDVQNKYSRNIVWDSEESTSKIAPHVYETSARAYKGLLSQNLNQSILVSGESGAGKTETVKICLNHLASIAGVAECKGGSKPTEQQSQILQRVIDANPLLEAFGNAKTRRNDNSSRFGKYIQLAFEQSSNTETKELVGSTSQVYLLEKSRVVSHDENERTFHIFYQLLSSDDSIKTKFWKKLKGKSPEDYRYVGSSATKSIEGKLDQEHFLETIKSLGIIGIKGESLKKLMRAICAVVQLGNIGFSGSDDESAVSTPKALKDLASLIGVPDEIMSKAFTERTMTANGESYTVPLSADFARDSCDSLAKEIYQKTFLWLVKKINAATEASSGTGKQSGYIGLLDIFGFESFEHNGFEQLMINFANEKLQQKFTQDIFREVQSEYEFEGIALQDILYDDNSHVVDLIESPKMGLLAMLNDECVRPKGSDREFVYKAITANAKSNALISDKKYGPNQFGIRHYCADIVYDAAGFIAKNNDTLATDLLRCASLSTNEIVAGKVEDRRRGGNVVATTVWTQYRSDLAGLMSELSETQSRYIRCLKPNELKQPKLIENGPVLDQLRSAGVVAAITISRSAFPNRVEHLQVWDRFRGLFPVTEKRASNSTQKGLLKNIETVLDAKLKSLETSKNGSVSRAFVIGKTRVYFRSGALEFLETERFKGMGPAVIKIQSVVRGFIARRRERKRLRSKDEAASRIQAIVRAKLCKSSETENIQAKKNRSKKIEALRRMKVARDKRKLNKSATVIQAMVRGVIQRPKYRRAIKEEKEVGGIQDQIKMLKEKLAKSEEIRVAAVKEAEDRAQKAMLTMENSEMGSAELQNISHTAKLAESEKVLEFVRRERKRLMGLIKTHKARCERTQTETQQYEENTKVVLERKKEIQDFITSIEANKPVFENNKNLYVQQIQQFRKELQTMQAHLELEDGVKGAYQDAVERIVAIIQEECTNDDLVEDIYLLAMECGDFGADGNDDDEDLDGVDKLDDLADLDLEDDLSDTDLELSSQNS